MQGPLHAESLAPVAPPHVPAAHGSGDDAPGHQKPTGHEKQPSGDDACSALERPGPHDVGADEFDGQ